MLPRHLFDVLDIEACSEQRDPSAVMTHVSWQDTNPKQFGQMELPGSA